MTVEPVTKGAVPGKGDPASAPPKPEPFVWAPVIEGHVPEVDDLKLLVMATTAFALGMKVSEEIDDADRDRMTLAIKRVAGAVGLEVGP